MFLILTLISTIAIQKRIEKNNEQNTFLSQSQYDKWYYEISNWTKDNLLQNGNGVHGGQYAWEWSYIGNSLIEMYKATGDDKYLNLFVSQAEFIFSQTDQKLGKESFTNTGLSLPAWSDDGHYSSGEFNYIYPVHTGMIMLPILRFVNEVKENNLSKYNNLADEFLKAGGKALAIHNNKEMWIDINENEGFFLGHPFGEGIISEANKIGIPNRIFIYLAACGLYDKLTDGSVYTQKIEKSLRYFKSSLLKYDKNYDSYYWSYWEHGYGDKWEDISHASLTVYGLFLLKEEAGFDIFSDREFTKFTNIIFKLVNKESPPKVRSNIHPIKDEKKIYYLADESNKYFSVLRWAFLGEYNKKAFEYLEGVYKELNQQEKLSSQDLFSISLYIKMKKQFKNNWFKTIF